MRIALITSLSAKTARSIPFSSYIAPAQRIERYWKKQGHFLTRFDPLTAELRGRSALDFIEFAKVQDLDFALGFGLYPTLELLSSSSLAFALFLERADIRQLVEGPRGFKLADLRRARALVTDDLSLQGALEQLIPLAKGQIRCIQRSYAIPPHSSSERPGDLGLPANARWFLSLDGDRQSSSQEALCEYFGNWHRQDPHLFLLTHRNSEDLQGANAAKSVRRLGVHPILDELSTAAFSFAAKRALGVIDLSYSKTRSHFALQALGMKALLLTRAEAIDRQFAPPFGNFSLVFKGDADLLQLCRDLIADSNRHADLRVAALKFAQTHHHFAREARGFARVLDELK